MKALITCGKMSAVVVIGFLLGSCSNFPKFPTYGTVIVSRPQVFLRERLIEDRLREEQWLKKQYAITFEPGYQGYMDRRLFQGLYQSLEAQFSPVPGRLADTTLREQTASIKRQGEIDELNHKIDILSAQSKLTQLQNAIGSGNVPSSPNSAPGSSNTGSATPTDSSSDIQALKDRVAKLETLSANAGKPTLGLSDLSKPGVPSPTPEQTKTQTTGIERLNDEKAYRDAISAALREKQLDDSHDLRGATLYELKFDVSLIPGDNTRQYAKVNLEVISANEFGSDRAYQGLYQKWLQSVSVEIGRESVRLQQKLLSNQLGDEVLRIMSFLVKEQERQRLHLDDEINSIKGIARALIQDGCKPGPEVQLLSDSVLEKIDCSAMPRDHVSRGQAEKYRLLVTSAKSDLKNLPHLKEKCIDPFVEENAGQEKQMIALACYVQYKYQHNSSLENYFEVSDPIRMTLDSQPYFVSKVTPGTQSTFADPPPYKGFRAFYERLGINPPSVHVATVEPKEYVQNISDVAARENLTNLVLSLGASLPNGISASEYTQYIKRSQELLQAIVRRPLAMSFNNDTAFGWILGPRFMINKDLKADFIYTPIRHSFTASIGVPGWYNSVCLTGSYNWIDSEGKQGAEAQLWPPVDAKTDSLWQSLGTSASPKGHCPEGSLEVDLAPDMSALTIFLMDLGDKNDRRPKIEPRWGSDPNSKKLFLKKGQGSQALMIPGRDLWRNPQVFVSSLKADRVEVLPDMEGLIAYFDDEVRMPDDKIKEADLTVITSFGKDRLQKGVVLDDADTVVKFAKLQSAFVVADDHLMVGVNSNLMPRNYKSLSLRIKPAGAAEWLDIVGDPIKYSDSQYGFKLGFEPKPGWPKVAAEFLADVQVKLNPFDAQPTSVLIPSQSFVHFIEESERRISLLSANVKFTKDLVPDSKITLDIPNETLFYKAYPTLASSLNMQTARLSLKKNGVFIAELPLKFEEKKIVVAMDKVSTEKKKEIAPEGSATYDLEITFLEKSDQKPIPVDKQLQLSRSN